MDIKSINLKLHEKGLEQKYCDNIKGHKMALLFPFQTCACLRLILGTFICYQVLLQQSSFIKK